MDDRTEVERYDLAHLTPSSMVLCGRGLRREAAGSGSLEAAAQAISRQLHRSLWDPAANRPAAALVRLYRTISYSRLEPDLQEFATAALERRRPWPDMKCLTLLGTAGDRLEWNSRRLSEGHRAIPLPSADAIARLPMVARLISQLGVDPGELLAPGPIVTNEARPSTNVFHVAEAAGSEFVPAQADFVLPYGIRSVAGFGGRLGTDLYAVIIFSRVPVDTATADVLGYLGSDVRLAVVPTLAKPIFDE